MPGLSDKTRARDQITAGKENTSPAETGPADASARPAMAVFLVGELVALVFFMFISRRMWFGADEWQFLAFRTAGNLNDLFRPFYEHHWVTLPVLAYRALWWIFGLRSYRPYQFVIVSLHLIAAYQVRAIMRRIDVRPWTATLFALTFVFFGSGYLNIVSPFQMTLVGSLVFGLAHLMLATHDGGLDRRDAWGLAAGCAALMCSGIGITMVITVGATVLLLRGWRIALVHTVPLGCVYIAWYAAIGHQKYPGDTAFDANIGEVARTALRLLRLTFTSLGHYRGVGALLGVLIVVGLAIAWVPRRAELRRQVAITLGMLIGAAAFLLSVGVGRGATSNLATFGSPNRYISVAVALMLPAAAVAADAIMKRWRAAIPIVMVLVAVGIAGNLIFFVRSMRLPASVASANASRDMILTLPRLQAATDVPRSFVPNKDGFFAPVSVGWLLDGAASGRIPKPRKISAGEAAIDTLRLSFEQDFSVHPRDHCVDMRPPRIFHLRTGQHILVGVNNGIARIVPVSTSTRGVLRFNVIAIAGWTFTAIRPATFEVRSTALADPGSVCVEPDSLAGRPSSG